MPEPKHFFLPAPRGFDPRGGEPCLAPFSPRIFQFISRQSDLPGSLLCQTLFRAPEIVSLGTLSNGHAPDRLDPVSRADTHLNISRTGKTASWTERPAGARLGGNATQEAPVTVWGMRSPGGAESCGHGSDPVAHRPRFAVTKVSGLATPRLGLCSIGLGCHDLPQVIS